MLQLSCYFLLNYASVAMLRAVWTAGANTCYFLLNYAQETRQAKTRLEALVDLLFSFELCQRQNNTMAKGDNSVLAIFFWIMQTTEDEGGMVLRRQIQHCLLFSFELCLPSRADVLLWSQCLLLAIFFWIMHGHSCGYGGDERQKIACYFLLNYAGGRL